MTLAIEIFVASLYKPSLLGNSNADVHNWKTLGFYYGFYLSEW